MKPVPDLSLYLVTDRSLSMGRSLEEIVLSAVRGGVTAVQLREKDASTREFLTLALKLKENLGPLGIPLIINDRIDIALAAGADGVHIGQEDMPYPKVRKLLGPEALIGLSVESEEQALEADRWDVDYLGVSPIFTTPTKAELETEWGLQGLSRLRRLSRKFLLAIGGISSGNAAQVLRAGADGLAVVSAICSAADPGRAAAELRSIIDSIRQARMKK
jgi:thiamine-phosphate pyrophosphorylase